jgi:phage repressor protein C with HTH and peptisase S24 domain
LGKVNVPAKIGQEIQLARIKKNWSQTDLANLFGWGASGQTLISRLEKGSTKTDEDKLRTILEFLKIRQDATDDQEDQNISEILSEYRLVPEYNVRVSAGHGEYQGIEVVKRQLQIPQIWLPENGQLGLVRVEGDSMFPTINNGDYVAVEFGSGYTADGLYLIRVDDTAFVKRLQRQFGSIRIISDNPQYEEMKISPDDGNEFSLIGRVTLIVRKT